MSSDVRGPLRRLLVISALLVVAVLSPLWLLDRFPVGSGDAGSVHLEPLAAARPRGDSPTRFLRLPPQRTGVQFTNELHHHNTHTYLTNGAGLAVGDYDNDGWPDLYLVSQDGPNKLFRQIGGAGGGLRFEDVTAAAGGLDGGAAWGTGATFVDVDNDGWLDLYVCNMESRNLLYRNRGDGTFEQCAARFGLDIVAASTMAAFCDYDRDGDLDLYLLTNRALHATLAQTEEVLADIVAPADCARTARQMVPTLEQLSSPVLRRLQLGQGQAGDEVPAALREHFLVAYGHLWMAGQPDRLLRNDGAGFVEVTTAAGLGGPGVEQGMGLSATWWDYDDDGWPDLYVANDLESPDVLWRNLGDGTFRDVTLQTLPHTAYYGMGSDAGDVDNDGRLDLFVADMSATTHKKAKILMGDMNAQRVALIESRPQQQMRNSLFWNTGTARFQELARIAGVSSTDWTWSTLFGDLDNDGLLDLFVTNGIARFEMNPDVGIRVKQLWAAGRQEDAIAVIKNVPPLPERNVALRNTSDLAAGVIGFANADGTKADAWGLDHQGISHGAALVDLDRDGDLDVVTNNWNEPVGIWENRSAGAAGGGAIAVELRGVRSNRFGVGARLTVSTPDGALVRENWPSRGYLSGQEPRLHFGLGVAEQAASVQVRWPSGRIQVVADVPVGTLVRFVEPGGRAEEVASSPPLPDGAAFQPLSAGPAFRHRETPFDDYGQQFLLPHKLSQLGPGVACGDADGDGVDEVFVGNGKGHPAALLRRTPRGWQQVPGPWDEDADCEDMGALWLDFDGDGDQDLVVVSGGVEVPDGDERLRDRLYVNLGRLAFRRDRDALPDFRESGSCICAADFDGDADLDLFIGGGNIPGSYPEAPPSRLLRNDAGRFVDVTAAVAPALLSAGMVTGAVFTPIGDDAFPDLLIAARWQPVRCLENRDGAAFVDTTAQRGLQDCTGWWNGIAALDVDNDGDLDFVAANQGRNTKYKASREHPLGLVYNDFDGNGTRDLVETKYEGDNLLPVRGRSCSSQAMPFLAERFPTYEQFASSLLEDIYPRDKLASAGHLAASCMDSVLLRNDGERFAIEPLDQRAQLAPIFGLAVADFDGDGNLDVACGTNFFSPEPETGWFDGGLGLLLRGDGRGLSSMSPADSGIVHFADHKGVATTDLDGDGRPDLLFAANDSALASFRNRSATEALALRLRGPAGNPNATGAVIVVERADGSRQALASLAGGGYLSQSSSTLWVSRGGPAVVAVEVRWPDGTTSRHTDGTARSQWSIEWQR